MKINSEQIERFLTSVDKLFPVPLSEKQDLRLLSQKFCDMATLEIETEGDDIVAMVAGYTKNAVDNIGYISVVATLPSVQGRGYASSLVRRFLENARIQGLSAVHLYTHATNLGAIRMYEKIGFVRYDAPNEPRPDDVHLIYNFTEDN